MCRAFKAILDCGLSCYLFEMVGPAVFTQHHIKENGDGGSPQLLLGNQGHLQNGSHHAGDEADLIVPCRRHRHRHPVIRPLFLFIPHMCSCIMCRVLLSRMLTEFVPHVPDSEANQPSHVPIPEMKREEERDTSVRTDARGSHCTPRPLSMQSFIVFLTMFLYWTYYSGTGSS